MKKRLTNPFKLSGSYIGLILGLVIGLFQVRIKPNPNLQPGMTGIASPVGVYLIFPLMIIGFILGYLIHIWLKNKKSK